MKYLGIDYGDKKVGISVSDDWGKIAFPYKVIKNSKNLLNEILAIIEDKKIEFIVIGESLNFNGEPNLVMGHIDKFVDNLKFEIKIPVFFEQEFMTSVQAARFPLEEKMQDASAAALILQSFLDRKNDIIET